DDPEPPTASDPESDGATPEPARLPKVPVTIETSSAWVEIKIAREVHTINKLKGIRQIETKIRPGPHKVYKRLDPLAEWQMIGTVRIPEEADKPITIVVGAKATLE
ncbi:MAG: hypothetical protein KC457_19015, partial [Myxococcales bacterium]|nr:hypothetical protein [Myxococcales bacterium]